MPDYFEISSRLRARCEQAVAEQVFPGCSVGYILGDFTQAMAIGRMRYDDKSRKISALSRYDVASITKSIPTGCLVLSLIEHRRLSLDDLVVKYVPELKGPGQGEITVRHLLTYTAVFDLPRMSQLAYDNPDRVIEALGALPLLAPVGTAYDYANPPATLLGLLCERVTGTVLDKLAEEIFFGPMGMKSTSFKPLSEDSVPSEIDWRGEIKGEVHDDAAWVMRQSGQIAGHAGLFSTASNLLIFARMLLNKGELDGVRYFRPETIRQMHTNQIGDLGRAAGLGWEIGRPYMGSKTSDQAFGKSGFRSCMIVIDPAKQGAVVLLSNANYPHRKPDDTAITKLRADLCDRVLS